MPTKTLTPEERAASLERKRRLRRASDRKRRARLAKTETPGEHQRIRDRDNTSRNAFRALQRLVARGLACMVPKRPQEPRKPKDPTDHRAERRYERQLAEFGLFCLLPCWPNPLPRPSAKKPRKSATSRPPKPPKIAKRKHRSPAPVVQVEHVRNDSVGVPDGGGSQRQAHYRIHNGLPWAEEGQYDAANLLLKCINKRGAK